MKALGVLAFVFFGAGVAYMLRKWPAEPSKTYSQNAAREKPSILYYGALVLAFLVLLSIFTLGWMVPSLNLPMSFVMLFSIGVLAQAVCAIVPETKGAMVTIHQMAATVMYFCSVAATGVLASSLRPAAAIPVWTAFVLMIVIVGFALTRKKTAQRHALVFQTVHLAIFGSAFVLAAYIT